MDGWKCEICKAYNDILSLRCWSCQFHIPDWITNEYLFRVEIRRAIWFERILISMTEQEELFQKFYNAEKILVKDMDDVQLREHREELRQIAFEAKARAVAADDEDRERKSKKSVKEKEWTLSPAGVDQNASDAINAVKTRQARMTKLEKMRADLKKAGIDDETINEMMKNLERKATEKQVKTITFNKPTVEVTAVSVQVAKPVDNGDKKPFDPTSIKFGA